MGACEAFVAACGAQANGFLTWLWWLSGRSLTVIPVRVQAQIRISANHTVVQQTNQKPLNAPPAEAHQTHPGLTGPT